MLLSRRILFTLIIAVLAAPAVGQGKGGGKKGGGGGGGGGGSGPPANPVIAYVDRDVMAMEEDGSNAGPLLEVGRKESARRPAWSPDNTQLAVGGTLAGTFGLHIVEADGSGVSLSIPIASSVVPFPDWSPIPAPDGRHKIAYDALGAGSSNLDIWVVNPDGTGSVNLTNTPNRYESGPAFSRDGATLAYVRDSQELVVASLAVVDGQIAIVGEAVVYTSPMILGFPTWARSQDVVIVSEMRGLLMRLVLLDVYGAPATPVLVTASSTGDERWASFSPDDTRVVFHRSGEGIVVTDLVGGIETRISPSGYDPRWRY